MERFNYDQFPDVKTATQKELMEFIKNLIEENRQLKEMLSKAHVLMDKYEDMIEQKNPRP